MAETLKGQRLSHVVSPLIIVLTIIAVVVTAGYVYVQTAAAQNIALNVQGNFNVKAFVKHSNPKVGIHPTVDNPTLSPIPDDTFGMERLWDTGVTWCDMSPSENVLDFTVYDEQLTAAENRGVHTIVSVLGFPPPHSVSETEAENHPNDKRAGWLCAGKSESVTNYPKIKDWKVYVDAMVSHAHEWRTLHNSDMQFVWQIWNEPAVVWFAPPNADPEILAKLSETARMKIGEVTLREGANQPDAMLSPPMVPCATQRCAHFQKRFGETISTMEGKNGGSKIFDGWSAQIYPVGETGEETLNDFDRLWLTVSQWIPDGEPVWITEINANIAFLTPSLSPLPEVEQKVFVEGVREKTQSYGVDTVIWYRWGYQPGLLGHGEIVFSSESDAGEANTELAVGRR